MQPDYKELSTGPGEDPFAADVTNAHKDKVFDWEQLGEPLFVFSYTALVVGRQCLALALIALQVFSSRIQKIFLADAEDFLMTCDPDSIGLKQSYICEATKAFVRCFPPVSIIVALTVASQLILCQRLFYLMIRHGVLVDFHNLAPYKDPLFWWVVITCVLALSHFIFHMFVVDQVESNHHNLKAAIDGLRKDAVFFGLPAVFYIIFLYMSYDVEWLLLPLSKFWEEDPKWAEDISSEMAFVTETIACRTVLESRDSQPSDRLTIEDLASSMSNELARLESNQTLDFAQRSMSKIKPAGWASDKRQKLLRAAKSPGQQRTGLIARSWVADLLLDPRLSDAKSSEFYVWWLLWIAMTTLVCLAAVSLLALQIAKDVEDISNGESAEIVGTVVTSINVLAMIGVTTVYLYEVLPRCRAPSAQPIEA